MNSKAAQQSSAGTALIIVLVTLLALSVLVFKAVEKTAVQARNISLLALEYRSDIQARAALKIALDLLVADVQDEVVFARKAWTKGWRDRGVSIRITPCEARINLNGLTTDSNGRERLENALLSLLLDKGLSYQGLEHLLYWIGALEIGPGLRGAAHLNEYYAGRDSGYSPPGRALTRPEELLLVGGFEELSPEWIRSWFTVWGEPAKIDINFASRETALAMLPELDRYWDRIESFRTSSGFTHPNQLLSETGMDLATYNTVLPYLVFESKHFEIIIEIHEGSWSEKHRYIVVREGLNSRITPEVLVRDVLESRPL